MFFVYILKSEINNSFYIGCISNIDRRLHEHNTGLSKYTKNAKPWLLVYKEEFQELRFARKREKEIKNWKKRDRIVRLINNGPIV